MHRLVKHATAFLAIALVAVVVSSTSTMAQETVTKSSPWSSLAHPSFRAGQDGQVYYRGDASPASTVTTGPVTLDWQALYQSQMSANQRQDSWRLDAVQVARIEGTKYGFSASADTFTLLKQVKVGQYSGTGESQVLVQHGRRAYVVELIQPFGPGWDKIWTINSIREITSAADAASISRLAGRAFEYMGPNGPTIAAWNPTPPQQKPTAETRRVYYVQPGDTLWAISTRNGLAVYKLIELNPGINADALWVGQVIIIRDAVSIRDAGSWVPTSGRDSGSGQVTRGTTYIVEPGDTLWQIALRYGASVRDIMEANGIADANTLWVGQRLIIP